MHSVVSLSSAAAGRRKRRRGNGAPVIVCGIENPATGTAPARVAATLAKRLAGRLVLLHSQPLPLIVSEPEIAFAAPRLDVAQDVRDAARGLAQLAARAGVPASTEVRLTYGDQADRLLAAARSDAASFIVMGAQRHRPRQCAFTSSPTVRVIADAPCPVFVLPPAPGSDGVDPTTGWGQQPMAVTRKDGDAGSITSTGGADVTSSIVCGVDGSSDARAALRVAAQLSGQLGLRLVIAHVVQAAMLPGRVPAGRMPLMTEPIDAEIREGEKLLEQIVSNEGLGDAHRRVAYGFPAERLADLADEEEAELIIVGSRGRGAFKAAFLGSVSNDLIGVARCPVLVVPPAAAAIKQPQVFDRQN